MSPHLEKQPLGGRWQGTRVNQEPLCSQAPLIHSVTSFGGKLGCCFVLFSVSGTAEQAQFSLVLHEMQNINRSKRFPISVLKTICCTAPSNIACSAINSVFQDALTESFLKLLGKYCQEKCVHPAAAQLPRQQPFLEIKTAFLLRKLSHGEM